MTPREFVHQLLTVAPGFEPVYREHLADNDELLPHVLMGDFTTWFVKQYRARRRLRNGAELRRMITFLEEAFSAGDPDTENVIAVSFLENLDRAGTSYEGIKRLLGPRLREQLRELEG